MSARSTRAAFRAAGLALATSLAIVPAIAQDGAQPRDIPEGFVVPGPPPTGAPAGGTAGQDAPRPPATANPQSFAIVPPEGTTNWPCVQRRVESLTPAQLWAGPDLALGDDVLRTQEMRTLADTVIARRIPLAEAETMVVDFVASLPEDEREATAAALFADILSALNAERSEVMAGIERYGAKQKALATRLREENATFSALQRDPEVSAEAVEEARQTLVWDTRIFDERRSSLTYVCEVPTLIEQRAFALGRAIGRAL